MLESKNIVPFDGIAKWLEETLKSADSQFILAFTDNEVVLGDVENNALASGLQIDPQTLQRAHLFGANGEWRLLRSQAGFDAVWLDDDWAADDLLDERYPIWREGQQGLSYVAPPKFKALTVRHYIRYDDQGQAYFSHSRLVDLDGGGK